MRLLHFDALGRLVLTDFRGKTIPPYAILSHRWSDSEILIEDIWNGTYKKKEEGYRKLRFCANQAAQDDLQYFWIDTCCIDRWNLRELSKAINSMFQWYKDATRCYVFLSDVSVSTETEPVQRNDWEASFRASAWFTRGWTLQELIAPVSVEFFSCEGHPIGDKASLDQLIHEITDIPLAALCNCPLDQFTTSDRVRWVENRGTTEEEDIIYCLLGILGVSMPTLYGEGQESARSRLQAEVEAAGNASSIIPFSQNSRFIGREPQLAELEAKLYSNEQTAATLAIVGPVGTGKIQRDHSMQHDDDRLSIQSIESSITLGSTLSGLTIVEGSATVELERIFQEDVELIGLYRLALKDVSVEPDKLQRNIARLLQFFAKDLRREAGTNLERVASRFVQSKARYVAHCIVEKFDDTPRNPQRPHVRVAQGRSDGDDGKQEVEAQPEVNGDQFEVDDMDEVALVDEDYFEDLAMLRTFLVRSSAFQIFRARLTKFVLPRNWRRLDIDSAVRGHRNGASLSRFCRFSVSTVRIFKAALVAAGCLEPPLQPGLIRLRWQCVSG
jgi:hypothetical protein